MTLEQGSVVGTQVEPSTDESRAGLDRRSLIKRAAIVGATAWTAPMIVGSIASPAGALTAAAGCWVMYSDLGSGTWSGWTGSQPSGTGLACAPTTPTSCTSVNAGTATQFAWVNTPTPNVGDNTQTQVTVSIKGGYTCRVVAMSATVAPTGALQDVDACGKSGTAGNATFTGIGTTSGAVTPSGKAWDTDALTNISSAIGVIIQCP